MASAAPRVLWLFADFDLLSLQTLVNHPAAMETQPEHPPMPQASGDVSTPQSWLFRNLAEGRRTVFFWGLQLLFWGGVGLLMFLITSIVRPSAGNTAGLVLMRITLGFLMSGGLREIYRRPAARRQKGWKKALVIVGCCLAFALLEKPITLLLVQLHLPMQNTVELFQNGHPVALRFIVLMVWSGFYVTCHQLERAHALELRALRAEVAARENKLRQLQAQINPHFLFNALNTVLASKEDPEAVGEVTQNLADFLRFLLRETDELEPLARELDALETYLTVQRIRFGEKLNCQIQCDTAARSVQVPPMMIQPLLENAFNYGAETSPMPLQVKLSAKLADDFLNVTVANTGRWVEPCNRRSTGFGIRSLRQRLQILIGGDAAVETDASDGWVRMTIRIPLPTHPPAKAR